MTLAIYAKKCDVSFDELKRDAYNLLERFDSFIRVRKIVLQSKISKQALQAYKEPRTKNYHPRRYDWQKWY